MAPRDPVFIVGSARSGTTFLAKLFDSHPDVLYRHEPDSVMANADIPFVPRDDAVQDLLPAAGDYLDALHHVRATKVSGQRPVFDKSYRSAFQKKHFLASLYLAKLAEKAGGRFGHKHLSVSDRIDPLSRDRIVSVIKSVDTPWRTLLYSRARPTWRFIHILRHPCAMINSKLRGIELGLMGAKTYLRPSFDSGMANNYPFTLEDMETRTYEERLAFLWMICNQKIHDDMVNIENYRLVIYEALCQDLNATTRALFDFADLSFDDQTQRFLEVLEGSEARDPGYFNIVRSPRASLDKWREQLSDQQVENIAGIVRHSAIGQRFFTTA